MAPHSTGIEWLWAFVRGGGERRGEGRKGHPRLDWHDSAHLRFEHAWMDGVIQAVVRFPAFVQPRIIEIKEMPKRQPWVMQYVIFVRSS